MKSDDVKFVREINEYMNRGNDPIIKNNIFVASEVKRLLNLLAETEAQARYWHHFAHAHLVDNPTCNIRNHTFKEFEASVKKEWFLRRWH